MIPATHPHKARYKHDTNGRTTYSFKPVIAWDDNGQPLVAGERALVHADSWANFDGIVARSRSITVATIPGNGWRAEYSETDGSTFSEPVIAFAVREDGTGVPLSVGTDGAVDPCTSSGNFSRLYHPDDEQA